MYMFPDLPGRIMVHVGQILLHPAARIQLRLQRQSAATAAAATAVHRTKHRHLPIKDDCLVVVVVVALQRHAALSTLSVSAVSLGLYSYVTHKYTHTTCLPNIVLDSLSMCLSLSPPSVACWLIANSQAAGLLSGD
jgi:hypothetical protein